MAEWTLVVVTFVYVVATIFISVYNNRSSKATLDMLSESKRQFDEENRPWISVELIYTKRTFFGIRFSNHGKQPAYHVLIDLQQSFIDCIKEEKIRSILERQKGRECIINVGQHYDLFFGTNEYIENNEKAPITGTVSYQNGSRLFEEAFTIDIGNYATFYSVNSEMEDLLKKIDEQNNELKRIANTFNSMYQASMKDMGAEE